MRAQYHAVTRLSLVAGLARTLRLRFAARTRGRRPDRAPAAEPAASIRSSGVLRRNAPRAGAPQPRQRAPSTIVVPTGTTLPLVLHNAITTRNAQPGDPVFLETVFPILVDTRIVIPAGSYVQGEILEAKRPGKVKGRGEVRIRLNTIIMPNGYSVKFGAIPSNAGTGGGETTDKEGNITGDTDKAGDAGTVIKGTAIGAGIGAVAARSGDGAGIGAGVGAAVGLAAVMLTRGPETGTPARHDAQRRARPPALPRFEQGQFHRAGPRLGVARSAQPRTGAQPKPVLATLRRFLTESSQELFRADSAFAETAAGRGALPIHRNALLRDPFAHQLGGDRREQNAVAVVAGRDCQARQFAGAQQAADGRAYRAASRTRFRPLPRRPAQEPVLARRRESAPGRRGVTRFSKPASSSVLPATMCWGPRRSRGTI